MCLAISPRAVAEIRFKVSSGSCTQRTRRPTAPASTTAWASSLLCLAIQERAKAAASFTEGSNSSKQLTRASSAPELTTAFASYGECFATDLNT